MKLNFNLNITTLLLIAVGVFLFFTWRGTVKESNRWEDNWRISQERAEAYKLDAEGEVAYWKAAERLTHAELREALKSDSINRELAEKYRKISQTVKIETVFETKWDTLKVPVPIYIDKDTTIKYADNCLSMDLGFSEGLFSLSGVNIHNEFNMVTGQRKLGLFKTEYSVDIANTNPCITTTGIKTYKVVHKPKWYNNPLITGGIGFATGFILGGRK